MSDLPVYRLASVVLSAYLLLFSSATYACVEGCLFQKAETLRLEEDVSAVATGDLNNDGLPDIITSSGVGDYGLHIYFQRTDRRYAPAESWYFAQDGAMAPTEDDVALGDFNSDGNLDVVVTTVSGIRVLFRDSQGQFSSSQYHSMSSDYKLSIGDFNGDGRDDVAAIGWGNQQLSILLQNASGTLDDPLHYNANYAGWNDLEAADLNNDGLTDIVVMSGQLNTADDLSIFYQNASGGFNSAVIMQIPSLNNPGGIGIGDVNGDNLNDLVVLDGLGNTLLVYAQNQSGSLGSPVAIDSGTSNTWKGAIDIADMNQDGLKDIVLLASYGGMAIHLQKALGGFATPIYQSGHASSSIYPHGLVLTDLDGDGKTDAVVAKGYWMGGMDVHYATRADLELSLVADKTSAVVDEQIRYTASITNKGPDDARDVRLEHVLPSGMFSAAGIVSSQGNCDTIKRNCALGALKPGQAATVTFEAYSYQDLGVFTNTVNLTAFNYTALAKSASLDVAVAPGADLEFTTNNVNMPSHTTNLYYSAYVHNDSAFDAQGVVVSDILPAGTSAVTAVWSELWGVSQHDCLISVGRVDCEIGTLPAGHYYVVSIQVQVNTTSNLLNTFIVNSTSIDPNPDNNKVTRLSTYQGVKIDQAPVLNPGGPYTVPLGSTALMDARASYDPEGTWLSFAWEFDDGRTGSYWYTRHTFNTIGLVPVTVTVTDEDGGLSQQTFYVSVVNTAPVAYAGPPYYLKYKKSQIAFDAEGSYDFDGGPLTYLWDFGDGSSAAGAQAYHEYGLSGNYVATLTVSDGASSSVAIADVIVYNTVPQCTGGGSYTFQRNETITFSAYCVDGNGDPLTYLWNFGDGTTSTAVTATHAYANSGVYTVTLVVNDGEVNSQPMIRTYTITNTPPVANGGGPYETVKGQVLTVDGSTSSDADNDVLSYRWDFGDGTTATGASPAHSYSKGGRYKLRLVVNDGEVDSAVYETTVSVKNR